MKKEIKSLRQHSENVFVRHSVYGQDWDLYAIGLINGGVKVTAKTVDDFYSHALTYLHESCSDVFAPGWYDIARNEPADRLAYVRDMCANLKRIVKSFDKKVYEKAFNEDLALKYGLAKNFLPNAKTVKFVNTLKLSVPRVKKSA